MCEMCDWKDISEAPTGKEMFVAIAVTSGNGFTGGKPYTTDPWVVWQDPPGTFSRWPHNWGPTHFKLIGEPPSLEGAQE